MKKKIEMNEEDDIIEKLKSYDKRNKYYYYHLGKYFNLINDVPFIQKRYDMKTSTIYKYIRFYNSCEEYYYLYECDLGFNEIMKNIPEIIELYKVEDFMKKLKEKYIEEHEDIMYLSN